MSGILVIDGEHAEDLQPELSLQKQQQINAANTSARSECLSFSTLMYKKLPKELRDMVYSYLCLEDRQIPIGPYYHFRKYESLKKDAVLRSENRYFPRHGDFQTVLPDGRIRTDHDVYPQDDFVMPENHIFNPSYMGEEVVLETLEKYYESNSFSVCNVEGGMDNLCTIVTLGPQDSAVDFVPIDHICDLQIRVKCEHFNKEASSLESNPGIRLREFAEKELFLRHTVDSLRKFRSRIQTSTSHKLNIEVVLISDLKRDHGHSSTFVKVHITNFLQSVRNMIYELMHDRRCTTVRVTHQDDGLMAFPKNYTGLFSLTKEQWDYEKSRQQPNHDWTHDFWILPISSSDLPTSDLLKLGGYCIDTLNTFLISRWGINDILRETSSITSVIEGPYWPIGSPYSPEFA
ncbi:hypothetical protein BU25DRAFT_490233 [Macroventuria anomochaeta]|uniref:Uncharacterized protein n=1 Tax=Macroventuria anomochaeta TaxID=301207 RepID=A0ACB6S589_9PLEO|nr:uncharacterized protein BU25DRAFT_490233 [Macroventuria anomochaeta]KAF2629147.1 hypothetical protein BU25DRAFT_490233 [Macroventuria anomochaeta]